MRIWFDISGIYNWQGNFTGIQRVVYNLAEELNKADSSAGFFIYRDGVFSEVSFIDLEKRLETLNRDPVVSDGITRKKLSIASAQHRMVVALKSGAKDTRLEPYLRGTYDGLRKAYRAAKTNPAGPLQPAVASLFASEDIVIVVDGNWQFKDYAEVMIAAKRSTNFKFIHFVHDLVAVKNPAFASPGAEKVIGAYFKKIFVAADALIAISESTKRDIEWFLASNKLGHRPALFTITLGDNMHSGPRPEPIKPKIPLPEEFILAVSTIEIRKNYLVLYYVYKLAHERGIKLPHLLIVGRRGWMAEEAYALLTQDSEIKQRISILQGLDDQNLEWLYRNCEFTIFPSFYEGWGLPIAEALVHGKFCISSNASSMPEVGGDLITYVSPYDPSAMIQAITRLMDDDTRKEAERQIRNQYKSQPWGQTYKDMLEIIKNVQEDGKS